MRRVLSAVYVVVGSTVDGDIGFEMLYLQRHSGSIGDIAFGVAEARNYIFSSNTSPYGGSKESIAS